MGSLVHQTPPALPGQSGLAGSESCSSALEPGRSSCTFFHFCLNTSQDKAKSFSSEPMASQIKARLAVCFLVILQGTIYCLTGWWAAALQPGHPHLRDTPGWRDPARTRRAGAEAEGPAAAGQWSKEDLQKGDCSFPRWSAAGGSVASGKAGPEVTPRGGSEVTCEGARFWRYLLFWPELLRATSREEQLLWGIPQYWREVWGCLWGWGDLTSRALWHPAPCYLLESASGSRSPRFNPTCGLSQALGLCTCGALTDPLLVRSKRCGSSRELAREGALAAEVWEAVTPLATGGWPHPSRPLSHAAGYPLQPPTAAVVMSATTASHTAPSLLLP